MSKSWETFFQEERVNWFPLVEGKPRSGCFQQETERLLSSPYSMRVSLRRHVFFKKKGQWTEFNERGQIFQSTILQNCLEATEKRKQLTGRMKTLFSACNNQTPEIWIKRKKKRELCIQTPFLWKIVLSCTTFLCFSLTVSKSIWLSNSILLFIFLPMAQETGIQSQVESYQRLKKNGTRCHLA